MEREKKGKKKGKRRRSRSRHLLAFLVLAGEDLKEGSDRRKRRGGEKGKKGQDER